MDTQLTYGLMVVGCALLFLAMILPKVLRIQDPEKEINLVSFLTNAAMVIFIMIMINLVKC